MDICISSGDFNLFLVQHFSNHFQLISLIWTPENGNGVRIERSTYMYVSIDIAENNSIKTFCCYF